MIETQQIKQVLLIQAKIDLVFAENILLLEQSQENIQLVKDIKAEIAELLKDIELTIDKS